jgi:mannose-6-phosphate isomerase-like protein (cupin superfamily)
MPTSDSTAIRTFAIEELLAPHPPRTNLNVALVDGRYAMRIARLDGTFPRHHHPNGDEGWFVYRGRMRIDSELGSVELGPGEGALIPRGVRHSPTALTENTLVLVVNVRDFVTVPDDPSELAGAGYREIDAIGGEGARGSR